MERVIFHVDMDAFFVSVEELFDPSLKGKPVVVGGQRNERGVVSAASYAARKFGVHSAMPLRTAAKLCPQAIFVDGHPDRYREYSGKVYEVLNRFSPKLEMVSIDEAYVDMTGTERLHGPPLRAAHALHNTMKAETQLNCSIGIGTSRLIAKVCSDQAKPNGVLWILPGREVEFLAPLDVRKIPGVGKVMEKRLQEHGITKVGDLASHDEHWLKENFGALGVALSGKSRGLDAGGWFDSDIGEEEGPKSISHEHTFSIDTSDAQQLESTLARLTEMVCRRLREQNLHARTLQLKLRNTAFQTITRAHTLTRPTAVDSEVSGGHSRALSRELERRCDSSAGRSRLALRGRERADWPAGSTLAREMEPCSVGRRPSAREVRRECGVAGDGDESALPRASTTRIRQRCRGRRSRSSKLNELRTPIWSRAQCDARFRSQRLSA